ncbi:MAG TPA: TetR/AcrR family transcriptional regulator [Actinomycetales bacterium]|nr:TetR/AcrR family transcriptional regulator [Actinomycetales bacterium]
MPLPSDVSPSDDGHRRRYDTASLLDVAVQVFTERGYDGTSMGDLAHASGLSKSSLYHHFDSKEQLLRAALDRAVEPLFAVVAEPAAQSGRAIDRLEHVVRREVQVLVEQLPSVTLLLRVHGNTPTERWALERRREFDRIVADLVAQAAAEGDVRTDVQAGLVTRLLFGMINSLVEWYRPDEAGSGEARRGTSSRTVGADELADAVVRLAFDGLRR